MRCLRYWRRSVAREGEVRRPAPNIFFKPPTYGTLPCKGDRLLRIVGNGRPYAVSIPPRSGSMPWRKTEHSSAANRELRHM